MIPSFVMGAGGFIARRWKLAVMGVLLLAIAMLKLSLAGEQRHSARLQQRLTETSAEHDRFKADVAAKATLAKAQDEAHARRVERDQILINKETVSAYQKEIAALRARAAQRLRGRATAADSGGGGGTTMSGLSHTTGGTDGAAPEDGLPDSDALIASEIAVRLRALQQWVKGQEAVER